MKLALVVSDIDGTLVNRDRRLTVGTVAAVRRLTGRGVPFTVISARPPSGIAKIVEPLALRMPVAAFNGGTIVAADGSIAERHSLDPDVVRTSFAIAKDSGATPWVFARGRWHIVDPDNPHVAHERIASAQEPVVLDDLTPLFAEVDKLTWVSDDAASLCRLKAEMDRRIGPRATIAQSQSYYLDLTHPLANKGDGVAALARLLNIDLADVVVLGDMDNDLPMFGRAGVAIAMGQAPEEVRKAARYTTASNDEDGVAQAIDHILLPMLDDKR